MPEESCLSGLPQEENQWVKVLIAVFVVLRERKGFYRISDSGELL